MDTADGNIATPLFRAKIRLLASGGRQSLLLKGTSNHSISRFVGTFFACFSRKTRLDRTLKVII